MNQVRTLVNFYEGTEGKRSAEVIAVIPDGAAVTFFRDEVLFVHPSFPVRRVGMAVLQEAKPMTLEDWLYITTEIPSGVEL